MTKEAIVGAIHQYVKSELNALAWGSDSDPVKKQMLNKFYAAAENIANNALEN